ncbi:MAG: type III pantothenate kinase [Gemmatimonadota bacterium]
MILAIDVGNTDIACGLYAGSERRDAWRLATGALRSADEMALLISTMLQHRGFEPSAIHAASIGSVVPRVTGPLGEACTVLFQVEPLVVDATTPLPITLDVDEPLTVGADRIVNTLAVAQRFGEDTIVVDLGTATTYDCITRAGVFIGGVIAPGVQTSADALGKSAAKLPRFEPVRPERVIGRRTESCLASGLFWGAVDAIDGIVVRIREEWGREEVLTIATGGLATAIAPACRTVSRVEPWLTLEGLALAYEHARGKAR